ncbi:MULTISPECIES: MdtA/MuxA family multidrug efflux RND transporter periplasmic adaptor subunit [unclassified Pantoea]|uniref:MdtA/MuxA family multidrug efflux RND transporter periplasmic adaptor subunit n=1 Tax=unclassified Pantoea TaxID=2630326 RepID=UPI001232A0FB|nr:MULTISPECIES: MdtA/MuxA family multidrug efflux RND transporter periplasmic adaptor subunit [unclassified Pantoea]KAA5953375.1 MdtA/MuxA family multidrug efflux RND transporter periplasmic adaptor subunit [Pantoea sp. VH_24]KAA5959911.1 MdtA/MuxA family multidrug efflux RND transporter periplasmic adaptor subunit [Pantoea sp. VH_16]KAA5968418.1 MdtA/MuxA family multidrug efflux RND transporter periplasmic adaptor subunit [Pantoea sp. VH_18]KAA6004511.1 MdtA/MuxA family multidrug efflux RND t
MSTRHPVMKKTLIVLALIAVAAGGYYAWQHNVQPQSSSQTDSPAPRGGKGGDDGARRPLAPVQAATATRQSVPQFLSGLGTVTAANTATVRSRVNGDLLAIHFTEGQQVNAGDLLAEVDPRPYQVALTQAQGQLAKDQATLANARRDLARFEKLAKTSLVSQQELDTQRSLVSETLGTLKADEGGVASAQLNLTYSRITAPIAGRVGLKQVDVGNYVTSGDTTGIVVITQTHPIDVVFTLAENSISSILQAQKSGQPLLVEAWDRSNQNLIASGKLLSLDNQIDVTTGTIKIKARFDNQDDTLFPNQFVNVRLKVNTLQDAVVIPPAALQMGNEGHFVWVVNSDNKVSKKSVIAGLQDSEKVVISAGLEAGERVVTDGLDRLTEGAKVEVVAPQSNAPRATRATLPSKGERE